MTRQINVGGVPIGGGAPVTVQSMCDTDTRDAAATLKQIQSLAAAGCEIVRVAVPDGDAADALSAIVKGSPLPVVADIHFDYKLAVRAAQSGVAKVRVNPGNIGDREKVREVVRACAEQGIPIRVGVNAGSVQQELRARLGIREALLQSGLDQIHMLEDMGFTALCLSLKASNVPDTVAANQMASQRTDVPLHIGVTEAGTSYMGLIKSSAGIGALLLGGVGDTLRVSLTAPPEDEVRAGIALLRTLGLRRGGAEIISCPQCGRRGIDVASIACEVEAQLSDLQTPLKVAVMGCTVNGPGEAREADIGVAGGGTGQAVLFRNGEVIRKLREDEILDVLVREAKAMAK